MYIEINKQKVLNESMERNLTEKQNIIESNNKVIDKLKSDIVQYKKGIKEATKAIEFLQKEAKKGCPNCENKENTILSLYRQLDDKKHQIVELQSKMKILNSGIINDLTTKLEDKFKEIEILKEMLKSNKIEMAGKEKELKRIRSKLLNVQGKPPVQKEVPGLKASSRDNTRVNHSLRSISSLNQQIAQM